MDNETNIDTKKIINTNSPIVKFLKEHWWLNLIIGAIGIYAFFFGSWGDYKIKVAFKNSILHEIQVARDTLDYTLSQRKQNVRNRPTFNLELSSIVSESFADNPQLKTELIDLYRSLSSAKASALELMDLISKRNSNKTTIQNRENDINRAIQFADEVGRKLADYIDGSWDVPPPNMSPKDRIKYYETKRKLIYSAASDEQVQIKWSWENKK